MCLEAGVMPTLCGAWLCFLAGYATGALHSPLEMWEFSRSWHFLDGFLYVYFFC